MDYTDIINLKQAMNSNEITVQDVALYGYITKASRLLDRLCTSQPNVVNYFMTEDVTDEILTNGVIDYAGRLSFWPHKPIINSVTSLSYRFSPRSPWTEADLTLLSLEQETVVYEGSLWPSERPYVKVSYNGGLGTTLAEFPLDFVDVATVMAVRLFKEERAGLSDTIGVAELGRLEYTKAFPQRVMDTLNIGGYIRTAPWT